MKYLAYYKQRAPVEVEAPTSYEAQRKAAALFRARKVYDVTVVPAQRDDGTDVPFSTTQLPGA